MLTYKSHYLINTSTISLDPTVICNPKPVFPLDKGIGPSIIKVTPFGIIKFSIILKVEVVPTVGSSCIKTVTVALPSRILAILIEPTDPLFSLEEISSDVNLEHFFLEKLDIFCLILNNNQSPSMLDSLDRVKIHYFNGPHPSGNVGIHMHYLDPISSKEDEVWYLTIQDICKIGKLFVDGKINVTKLISMGGPGCDKPSYLKVYDGTPISHINDELELGLDDNSVVISGSVLSGKYININESVGFYHEILTILKNVDEIVLLPFLYGLVTILLKLYFFSNFLSVFIFP